MKAFQSTLREICKLPTDDVFLLAEELNFEIVNRRSRRYAFRPGCSTDSPMIVCHADTVLHGGHEGHEYRYSKGRAYSIALDDRLGIACMVNAIRQKTFLGDCAMLICDEEEIGRSSAAIFDMDIFPNFLVELDRRGTDVVSYEYDSVLLQSLLHSVDFQTGSGSFSDICYLESLGVVGFNVGIGYHEEHSHQCYADLVDTFSQLQKLQKFVERFGDIRLEHEIYKPYDRPYWQEDTEYLDWGNI